MKKLLFILSIILLSSCASWQIPYTTNSGIVDYAYLSKKGLFVTESNSVNFTYEPVGSVYASVYSGNIPKFKWDNGSSQDMSAQENKSIIISDEYKKADMNDALDLIYNQAVKFGANAVINLKISMIPAQYSEKGMPLKRDGILITGMAVKK